MKKIKRSKVLILGVFIYLIFQIGLVFISRTTETIALESEKLNAKITTKGLFIREEYLIKSNEKGIIEKLYDEGQKIKKSQKIAYIYKDNKINKINLEIQNLNKEINDLKIELQNNSNKLSEEVAKIQLKTKQEQKKILKTQKEKTTSYLKTDISGIISYKFDGNEKKYNFENLGKITKEDIENTINDYNDTVKNNNIVKEGTPVARIINNYVTYLAICVSEKESNHFSIGNNIKISFNDKEIDGKVYKIYQNKSDIVIIFKIDNQNVGIYDTRVEEFDIIYKQIEGFKIPKSSIKIVDNKKGVYVVNDQTQDIEFVELKGIEYENDEFVFIDYYNSNIDGIKTVSLYDEIILRPNNINKNIKMK